MAKKQSNVVLHKIAFGLCSVLARPFARGIFNFHYEPIPKIDGPYLLLANHNSDCDPGLLLVASKKLTYFVATENLARMGIVGWLLRTFFDPILHFKGKAGIGTIRNIYTRLKQGYNVALFPEGNRSFNGRTNPIPIATGKMAKQSKATLITYKLIGGYLTTPRWGNGVRKGRMDGRIANIYTPEMLRNMTDQEVCDAIEKDLFVDAYIDQQNTLIEYKGKALAENLESTICVCPECKRIGTLHSHENRFFCDCGFDSEYTSTGYLKYSNGEEHSVTELDSIQQEVLSDLYFEDSNKALFEDNVNYTIVVDHQVTNSTSGKLVAYRDRLEFNGEIIDYFDISAIAINQKNLLLIHSSKIQGHAEFRGNDSFNALKYLYIFRMEHSSINGIM